MDVAQAEQGGWRTTPTRRPAAASQRGQRSPSPFDLRCGALGHGTDPRERRAGSVDPGAYGPYGRGWGMQQRLQKPLAKIKGLYLIKFAASVTACSLLVNLLQNFAEVLLPFIFAVLCMIILEPLKKFIMRILQQIMVLVCQKMRLWVLLESTSHGYSSPKESPANALYGSLAAEEAAGEIPYSAMDPGDPARATDQQDLASGKTAVAGTSSSSTDEQRMPVAGSTRQPVPVKAIRQLTLAVSIIICLLLTGRVLWVTAKIFFRAGYALSGNLEFYKEGATRLKRWVETYMRRMHVEDTDYRGVLDDVVAEVEHIGSIVTENVLYTALQAAVTFIFLIYMLWSPVKMQGNPVTREVFSSTARYLKVKCLISTFTGLCVAVILAVCGLELPAAFGLLSFLANFLPGIGSFVSSALPCVLAAIDVRQSPAQVLLAFFLQLAVHFVIDFVIEPVIFGMSVEIHSVIVILGIYFFYQVWGMPGMLLSVPLLAVMRVMMKSLKQNASLKGNRRGGDDTIVFLDSMLEGRWMSSVGERREEEELETVGSSEGQVPGGSFADVGRGAVFADDEDDAPMRLPSQREKADLFERIRGSSMARAWGSFYQDHQLLLEASGLMLAIFLVLLP